MLIQEFKMIPKIIHLCWFSGDPYPPLVKKCIDSWMQNMPNYQIMLWTEGMAREIGNNFINQALDKKKYAFAADVVRLYALYKYGGVYLDSDVYLYKPVTPLLKSTFVSVIEYHEGIVKPSDTDKNGKRKEGVMAVNGIGLQAAFLAAIPNHPLVKILLDYYKDKSFINKDGSLETGIIAPAIFSQILEPYGFLYLNCEQHLEEDSIIFPSYYIASNTQSILKNSYGVHCCNNSWKDKSFMSRIKKKINDYIVKIKK